MTCNKLRYDVRVRIEVKLRDGVKDPQAETIMSVCNNSPDLGANMIRTLIMGKYFEIEADEGFNIVRLCDKILANPVIEKYTITDLDKAS
jgi:phosphoribosylformylglycinamidine synthase|tara:strand:+ start:711 stop:980 length:270 start_codon:yes stop_codon:yes gene_type:complete